MLRGAHAIIHHVLACCASAAPAKWKRHAGKGGVFATKAVEAPGKGGVFAAKAAKTSGKGATAVDVRVAHESSWKCYHME